jgi:hypothetical protein
MDDLNISDEKRVLNALRKGNIPGAEISQICVGRERELKLFDELLDMTKMGGSDLKFINGNFGMGKSFLLKILKEKAFNDNFVVSELTLSNDVRMNKIEDIYNTIAKNIQCKTSTGLKEIIDRWYSKLRNRTAIYNDVDDADIDKYIESEVLNVLEEPRKINNSFANAIQAYINAKNRGDLDTENNAIAWVVGDRNLPATQRKMINVKGTITKENAVDFLKALSSLLKCLGYNGLVVLMDEAESIMILNTNQRKVSFDYIRDIFDACSGEKFNSTLFVLAGTPEFFDDDKKGVKSYSALYDRIKSYLSNEFSSVKSPVIIINGLTDSQLESLGKEIIKMHEDVYDWDTTNLIKLKPVIAKSQESAKLNADLSLSREFIRRLIEYLDSVEEKPDNAKKILKEIESTGIDDDIGSGW